jgi:hypothetical protein
MSGVAGGASPIGAFPPATFAAPSPANLEGNPFARGSSVGSSVGLAAGADRPCAVSVGAPAWDEQPTNAAANNAATRPVPKTFFDCIAQHLNQSLCSFQRRLSATAWGPGKPSDLLRQRPVALDNGGAGGFNGKAVQAHCGTAVSPCRGIPAFLSRPLDAR